MKLLVAVLALFSLLGCSRQYEDLDAAFAVEAIPKTPSLDAHDLSITSQRHRGISSYRGISRVYLFDDSIGIEIRLPFSKPLRIPTHEIAACGMTCFGTDDQNVDFFVPRTGSKLSIPSSGALLDWCWRNKKPMLPERATSDWLYKSMPLPASDGLREQFSAREVFDHQVSQSCLGY